MSLLRRVVTRKKYYFKGSLYSEIEHNGHYSEKRVRVKGMVLEQWPFGIITLIFYSEQWPFGAMIQRSNGPSDQWPVGAMTRDIGQTDHNRWVDILCLIISWQWRKHASAACKRVKIIVLRHCQEIMRRSIIDVPLGYALLFVRDTSHYFQNSMMSTRPW